MRYRNVSFYDDDDSDPILKSLKYEAEMRTFEPKPWKLEVS